MTRGGPRPGARGPSSVGPVRKGPDERSVGETDRSGLRLGNLGVVPGGTRIAVRFSRPAIPPPSATDGPRRPERRDRRRRPEESPPSREESADFGNALALHPWGLGRAPLRRGSSWASSRFAAQEVPAPPGPPGPGTRVVPSRGRVSRRARPVWPYPVGGPDPVKERGAAPPIEDRRVETSARPRNGRGASLHRAPLLLAEPPAGTSV